MERLPCERAGQQPALDVSAEEAEFQGDVSNAEDVRKHEARLKELRDRLKEERDVWEVKVCIRPCPSWAT